MNSDGDVLVVNQHGNSWSLPKGHLDPGEDALAAARREIREESGISDLTLVRPLGQYQRFRIGLGGGEDRSEMKMITLYLFTTPEKNLNPIDSHNPEARWVRPEKVQALLTHPKDREFFATLLPSLKGAL